MSGIEAQARGATVIPRAETVWREAFRVHFYEAEPNGRASAAALCRYFLEAADNQCSQHGCSLAQLHKTGRMWVLGRFALRMYRFPCTGQAVTIETWPSGSAGSFRGYRDFRASTTTDEILGQACSVWFLLDAASRRPVRLPQFILDLNLPAAEGERVDARKLTPPVAIDCERELVVRFSDLDANAHANSACYLEWLLEPLPASLRHERTLSSLEIVFQNEVLVGEHLISAAGPGVSSSTGTNFAHALRSGNGQPVAMGRSEWI